MTLIATHEMNKFTPLLATFKTGGTALLDYGKEFFLVDDPPVAVFVRLAELLTVEAMTEINRLTQLGLSTMAWLGGRSRSRSWSRSRSRSRRRSRSRSRRRLA